MKTKISVLLLLAFIQFTSAQTQGTLTVSTLTSKTTGSVFDPYHVMAIWIVNSNGAFVKSLMVYAAVRQTYLNTWKASTPGLNKVDAITGATQDAHSTRTCTWNGKDASGVVVPDGTYSVKMELTDKNAQGSLATFAFVKGSNSQTLTPAAVTSFANINIVWASTTTGIEDHAFSNQFDVYPSPVRSILFVKGIDINQIDLCTIEGKRLLTGNLKSLDLSAVPKGLYLVIIKAKGGTVIKKIEKQ